KVAVSVANTLPQFSESDSSVRVDTANGYGSTATRIRRFSNIRDNIGSDIVYTDDPVNGGTFTIKTDGLYAISYNDSFGTADDFGISKNTSSVTTVFTSLPTNEKLAQATTSGASVAALASGNYYLAAGD